MSERFTAPDAGPARVVAVGTGLDASDDPTGAPVFAAPAAWQAIDFISDLHLAEDTPRAFEAWAGYLRTTRADAVFILGDLFDAWPGDDARHEGFEARCAEVLRAAAATRFVAFMVGNRDFLVGPAMLADCGVYRLGDPTVVTAFGERALLTHGDAWCLGDTDYQRIRPQLRSPAWQNGVLAQGLAQRRALARQLRQQSEQHASGRAPGDWADVDPGLAARWLAANAAPLLVHGHTHRPASEAFADGAARHVLSDWSLDDDGTARAEVLRWRAGGFVRIAPEHAG